MVTEADLDRLKPTSLQKKTTTVIGPAARLYGKMDNPGVTVQNSSTLNCGDDRIDDLLPSMADDFIQATQEYCLMDVRSWVEKHDRKQLRMSPLMTVLDSGVVEPIDRREFVRIAVGGMIDYNHGNLYPTCQLKTQLARDIITAFPKLMSASGGYEHFFDPKTNRGFIEFRLKTMRLKLNPAEKKRATSSLTREKKTNKEPVKVIIRDDLIDENVFNVKVRELSMSEPTKVNKSYILRLSKETRPNRQNQIKSAVHPMSIATIFNLYPRFKDFDGEVIRREFSAEHPNNDLFVGRFTSYYAPRILQYCISTKQHLLQAIQDIGDDNLKALILLPELLPSPNYTKKKSISKSTESKVSSKLKLPKTVPNEALLQYVNTTDESLLNEMYGHTEAPFLICCTNDNQRRGHFFIKTEGHTIHIGTNAIVAFDTLVKLHHCFNVPFASDLVHFYDFITGCIMQLNEPKGCCVALNSSLSNVPLPYSDFTNMLQSYNFM